MLIPLAITPRDSEAAARILILWKWGLLLCQIGQRYLQSFFRARKIMKNWSRIKNKQDQILCGLGENSVWVNYAVSGPHRIIMGNFFKNWKKRFFCINRVKREVPPKFFFGKYSWMSPLLSPILVLPYLFAVWCQ